MQKALDTQMKHDIINAVRKGIFEYQEKAELLEKMGKGEYDIFEDVIEQMSKAIEPIIPHGFRWVKEHIQAFSAEDMLQIEEWAKNDEIKLMSYGVHTAIKLKNHRHTIWMDRQKS
jgi:leucyl-tRNA synthetase